MADTRSHTQRRFDELLSAFMGTNQHRGDFYKALDAAGLLVTPEMQRAAEACVGLVTRADALGNTERFYNPETIPCIDAGRALLAARKPVESWTANGSELWMNGRCKAELPSHAHAKTAAAALNALEPKP